MGTGTFGPGEGSPVNPWSGGTMGRLGREGGYVSIYKYIFRENTYTVRIDIYIRLDIFIYTRLYVYYEYILNLFTYIHIFIILGEDDNGIG